MDYEYFISFRKQNGIGGEIANNVYDVLGEYLNLNKTDLKNKCYFSPENSETGDDFRKNEQPPSVRRAAKFCYFFSRTVAERPPEWRTRSTARNLPRV